MLSTLKNIGFLKCLLSPLRVFKNNIKQILNTNVKNWYINPLIWILIQMFVLMLSSHRFWSLSSIESAILFSHDRFSKCLQEITVCYTEINKVINWFCYSGWLSDYYITLFRTPWYYLHYVNMCKFDQQIWSPREEPYISLYIVSLEILDHVIRCMSWWLNFPGWEKWVEGK